MSWLLYEGECLLQELLEKYADELLKESLIKSIKFKILSKFESAMEELLSFILGFDVKIIDSHYEKNISFGKHHEVFLDYICKIKGEEIVHIEMQISNNDDMFYRNRFYHSAITIEYSHKSKDFVYKDIPKIISIMFCDFNIFENDNIDMPLYRIKRVVEGTDKIADNGITEIYVNLKSKNIDPKYKALFDILKTSDYVNDEYFPEISIAKRTINKEVKGGKDMYTGVASLIYNDVKEMVEKEAMKEGMEKGMEKGIEKGMKRGIEKGILKGQIDTFVRLVKKGLISMTDAAKELGMTEKKFMTIVNS